MKTELWDLDGTGSTPYSTTENKYNGLDQVLRTRQYSGDTSSSTYQDHTTIYDGHGRAWKTHRPEQQVSGSPAYTETTFNPDDTPATVADARGATRTFTYNSLGLATQIAYSVPGGSGIAVTPTATFAYDNLGNRTSASNSAASTTYTYDSLSRLASESQTRDGLTNPFVLTYQYAVSGKLSQMTDGFGGTVIYELDKTGRNAEIDSTGYNESAAPLITDITYRAWGALKSEEYRSGEKLDLGYDSRLKLASYAVDDGPGTANWALIYKSYNYHPDGKLETAINTPSSPYTADSINRAFEYDFAGRLRSSAGGAPYDETVTYNAFNNMTQTSSRVWSEDPLVQNFTYANNRNTTFTYDADGRVITDGTIPTNNFDAQGNPVSVSTAGQMYFYDADGKRTMYFQDAGSYWGKDFYFYSTVLGGKIVGSLKAHSNGYTQGIPWEKRRFLYKDGALFATYQSYYESGYNPAYNDYIRFRHEEPSGEYKTSTHPDHMTTTINDPPYEAGQIDSRGVDVGVWDPQPFTDEQWQEMMQWMNQMGSFFNNNSNCTIDGVWAFQQDCDRAIASVERNLRANGFGSLLTGYYTSQDIGYYEDFDDDIGHETQHADGSSPVSSNSQDAVISIRTGTRFVRTGILTTFNPGIQQVGFDRQYKALYTAFGVLTRKLIFNDFSDNCRKKVFDKLKKHFKDFDESEFVRFINNSPSDGLQDGTTSQTAVASITASPPAAKAMFPNATSIADAFAQNPGVQALASRQSRGFSAYFRPSAIDLSDGGNNSDNLSLLFHEALHTYGGTLGSNSYFDNDLQKAFNLTEGAPSNNITQYIRDHCF